MRADARSGGPGPRVAHRAVRWHDEFARTVIPLLGGLQRLARRILRNDDLAEDAVQEALISLWKRGELPPNPAGWLAKTVVHRSLHLNRCRRRRQGYEERASLQRAESDSRGEGIRFLEAQELGRRIESALAALPERLRAVFVLREVERLDYESIALALQIPLGTVRSRLSRSREALQDALGQDHPRGRSLGESRLSRAGPVLSSAGN